MGKRYDTVIIGGGFYGLRIALFLREELGVKDILILEKEPAVMTRASYVNQARVHNGYHYPRSILTSLRSRINFPIFVDEYNEAVVNDFDKYYAVAKSLSKVNARQFKQFCDKIGADIAPAPATIKAQFNPYMTDDVFRVKEYAFDSWKLRDMLMRRIHAEKIEYHTEEEALEVSQGPDGKGLLVKTDTDTYQGRQVINCGYSQINKINRASNLPVVPYKHELAEMCLVQLPPGMEDFSVTVMDGPFFSIMPFPTRKLHTLSHVRYTPHTAWPDKDPGRDPHAYLKEQPLKTHFPQMYADVVRFIPGLKGMQHKDSVWEVKTVLAQSEDDDSRPILFKPHLGLENYICIMGGKLDNIYDVFKEIEGLYGEA